MNDFIKRQRYLTESRDNAARARIRYRQLSREEREYRKWRIIYLALVALWALFLTAAVLFVEPKNADEPTPPPEVVEEVITIQPIIEALPEAVPEVEEEFDPVRDDIPMDAETQRLLYQACTETGVPYELALAVVWYETDFRNIYGDGGDSAGYMQVQKKWHKDRMKRLGVKDLKDPYGNFLVGCDYLAELIGKYEDTEKALVAYNQGSFKGTVTKYAKSVVEKYNELTKMEEN